MRNITSVWLEEWHAPLVSSWWFFRCSTIGPSHRLKCTQWRSTSAMNMEAKFFPLYIPFRKQCLLSRSADHGSSTTSISCCSSPHRRLPKSERAAAEAVSRLISFAIDQNAPVTDLLTDPPRRGYTDYRL